MFRNLNLHQRVEGGVFNCRMHEQRTGHARPWQGTPMVCVDQTVELCCWMMVLLSCKPVNPIRLLSLYPFSSFCACLFHFPGNWATSFRGSVLLMKTPVSCGFPRAKVTRWWFCRRPLWAWVGHCKSNVACTGAGGRGKRQMLIGRREMPSFPGGLTFKHTSLKNERVQSHRVTACRVFCGIPLGVCSQVFSTEKTCFSSSIENCTLYPPMCVQASVKAWPGVTCLRKHTKEESRARPKDG